METMEYLKPEIGFGGAGKQRNIASGGFLSLLFAHPETWVL